MTINDLWGEQTAEYKLQLSTSYNWVQATTEYSTNWVQLTTGYKLQLSTSYNWVRQSNEYDSQLSMVFNWVQVIIEYMLQMSSADNWACAILGTLDGSNSLIDILTWIFHKILQNHLLEKKKCFPFNFTKSIQFYFFITEKSEIISRNVTPTRRPLGIFLHFSRGRWIS